MEFLHWEKPFFDKYAPIFCSQTPPVLQDERLLIDEQGAIPIYYAPFEYINRSARVVLVGITPDRRRWSTANNEARRVLMSGKSSQETMRAAKDTAALAVSQCAGNLISPPPETLCASGGIDRADAGQEPGARVRY